jgi:tetratricopeptide (TPR) repeat protein
MIGPSAGSGRPDPTTARTPGEFVDAMQRLKRWSGLGFRRLEQRAGAAGDALPRSTVTAALARDTLPREDLVAAFARTCGCGPDEVERWVATRRRLAATASPPQPTAAALTVPTAAAVTVPAQLPPAVTGFVGRTCHLDTLTALLDADEPTVVITAIAGTAGVGKTALAVHWAHRVADRFPDGQLYVDLRGFDAGGTPVEPAVAVRGLLDGLQVPTQHVPADLATQTALYRSLLAGRRILLVLDNARDAEQVRPLLPGTPGCLAVVTSRNQLTGLVAAVGAHPLILDVLSAAEARELLARRLGADRAAAEPDAIDEIITRCARLPLALAIVAARAANVPHVPLRALVTELGDAHGPLDALAGGDPASDVRAVFSWSYRTLSPGAARLFRLLGLHPGPDIAAPAAASLAGLPLPQVPPMLAELTRIHLIVERSHGRYALHDLLHAYAAEQAQLIDTDEQRHAATRRMLDHYLHTAHAADRLLSPTRDPITLTPARSGVTLSEITDHERAIAWFTAEHAVLLTAVDYAVTTGFDTHTWQLAWTLDTFLHRQGHRHDRAAAASAGVTAAHRSADPSVQARAHRLLALAYTRLGRLDDAHTQLLDALDLTTEAGDLAGQAITHHNLAHMWEQQGHYREALDHARQTLDLYRVTGHRDGQAQALSAIGWCHACLGDHRQALTCCQQALGLLEELDDRIGQAATWDSLGYAHHHLGEHSQAIASYQHALDLVQDLSDRSAEADILTHLGETHHASGGYDAARTAWQRALAILDELDHPDADRIRAELATLDTPIDVDVS